jgi:hypothetical protein
MSTATAMTQEDANAYCTQSVTESYSVLQFPLTRRYPECATMRVSIATQTKLPMRRRTQP